MKSSMMKMCLMFMMVAGIAQAQSSSDWAARQAAEAAQSAAIDDHDLMSDAKSDANSAKASAEMQEPMCTDTTELGNGDADLAAGDTDFTSAESKHSTGGTYMGLADAYMALAEVQWDAGNYASAVINYGLAEDWYDLASLQFQDAENWYGFAEFDYSAAFDHYFAGTP